MSDIVTKILEKDEKTSSNLLTIGIPDENGLVVTLSVPLAADIDALVVSQSYTLAFVPFVPPASDNAVPAGVAATTPGVSAPTVAVPTDHPTVITPDSANETEPATVADLPTIPAAAPAATTDATAATTTAAPAADPTAAPASPATAAAGNTGAQGNGNAAGSGSTSGGGQ
jgi:septal ring-binding cell division protein DamX